MRIIYVYSVTHVPSCTCDVMQMHFPLDVCIRMDQIVHSFEITGLPGMLSRGKFSGVEIPERFISMDSSICKSFVKCAYYIA